MNKAELVKAISERAKVSQTEVDAVLHAFVGVTTEEVNGKGGQVSLPGLGTFKQVARAAKVGRNPSTGATIQIPAKNVMVFKLSSTLKS